MFAAFSCSFP